jgi:hypothetical protein
MAVASATAILQWGEKSTATITWNTEAGHYTTYISFPISFNSKSRYAGCLISGSRGAFLTVNSHSKTEIGTYSFATDPSTGKIVPHNVSSENVYVRVFAIGI